MNTWFKRESKTANGGLKPENGLAQRIRRRKPEHKSTREGDRVKADLEKEKRRHSDIMDIKASLDRQQSDESLYEDPDTGLSDVISTSDDVLPNMETIKYSSKESVKLSVTDEENEMVNKKGHRKTLSLSTPIEIVKTLGDEWFESTRREGEKNSDKKKSKESLWSEEDPDSIHGSNLKLNERKNSKKDDKRKKSMEPPKTTKRVTSVSALIFGRRKKNIEPVKEKEDRITPTRELIAITETFLDTEKRHSFEEREVLLVEESVDADESDVEVDAEDEESEEQTPSKPNTLTPKRRISRTISRSKSKSRGKSQTVRVNTLRKSQSGTLKRAKKKKVKARSKNTSVAETPVPKKKLPESRSSNYWPFSGSTKETRRDGPDTGAATPAPDGGDATEASAEREDVRDGVLWRSSAPSGKPVNRAESCREPASASASASAVGRRGKQRNASDPNRLTAKQHDCEGGAGAVGGATGAASGSSSSSSLSNFSNDSTAPPADLHASQSDFSEEEEPLAEAWSATVSAQVVESLSAKLRKRQELIHELITSESSHVRWLKVLHTMFFRPLERQEAAHLIPQEEVRALFPNLPAVRERHARLYGDLKTLRKQEAIVNVAPLAEAVQNTLGDPSYAKVLSRFCCGQRMALDALRERRRKNKELHHYLALKEQNQVCGRLQLRDLMAVVWQRLTKYQLLLEGVLSTLPEEEGPAEDAILLRRALDTAKDVLHRVDTAIRNAENEHRLRWIQSKLEVRAVGGELEEMRRLDLTAHRLVFEGELSMRTDTKKTNLLALLTAECLVLLHREGDKFVLKQMSQFTPIIKWSTVLFRPNAAVKNTFFLMNINGVQMYELSANNLTEYNTWTRYISEMPLAEGRVGRAPSVLHSREKTDESSGGVSRNASDASRTSTSSGLPDETATGESDGGGAEAAAGEEAELEGRSDSKCEQDTPEQPARPQLTVNGRITTHHAAPPPLSAAAVAPTPASHYAEPVLTAQEQLRRLDAEIARALGEKGVLVARLLGVPAESAAHVEEMAVAEAAEGRGEGGVQQLLLAAQAQANQLTEALTRALDVSEADVIASRHRSARRDTSGLCDVCGARGAGPTPGAGPGEGAAPAVAARGAGDVSFDMLSDASGVTLEEIGESSTDPVSPSVAADARLATRLVPLAGGLQATLAALLAAAGHDAGRRRELASWRDRADSARHRERGPPVEDCPPEQVDRAHQETNNGG